MVRFGVPNPPTQTNLWRQSSIYLMEIKTGVKLARDGIALGNRTVLRISRVDVQSNQINCFLLFENAFAFMFFVRHSAGCALFNMLVVVSVFSANDSSTSCCCN